LNVTIPPLVRAFLMAQLNIYFNSSPTGPLVLDLNRWLTDPVIDSIFDLVYSPDLLQSSLRLESELQGISILPPFAFSYWYGHGMNDDNLSATKYGCL